MIGWWGRVSARKGKGNFSFFFQRGLNPVGSSIIITTGINDQIVEKRKGKKPKTKIKKKKKKKKSIPSLFSLSCSLSQSGYIIISSSSEER